MKKRTVKYPDFDLACDICGEHFKTPQGLFGHKRFRHNINTGSMGRQALPAGPSVSMGRQVPATTSIRPVPPATSIAPADPSIKELKGEVERLELELKRRKLQSGFPSAGNEPTDIMAQSGLGAFDAAVKEAAQRRAMGFEQKTSESWLDKLLANPEGLRIAIDGLKGVLGVNRDTGDNLPGLLKEMGFSLKDLISQASAPKSGPLSIAGIDLTGANLTPELLKSILEFRAAEEKTKTDLESRKQLTDGLTDLVKMLSPELRKRFANGPPHVPGISGKSIEDKVLTCSVCGTENPLPDTLEKGMTIHCQGEGCDQSWLVEDDKPNPPQRRKRQAKVKAPELIMINCPTCGQAIDVTDKPLASDIVCPACQTEFKLISDTDPLPAAEPLTPLEKRYKSYQDQKTIS